MFTRKVLPTPKTCRKKTKKKLDYCWFGSEFRGAYALSPCRCHERAAPRFFWGSFLARGVLSLTQKLTHDINEQSRGLQPTYITNLYRRTLYSNPYSNDRECLVGYFLSLFTRGPPPGGNLFGNKCAAIVPPWKNAFSTHYVYPVYKHPPFRDCG